jgi:hypothetical protein
MPFVEYAHPRLHLRRPMDWIQIASPTTDGLDPDCISDDRWMQVASGLHLQCVWSASEGPIQGPLIAPLIRYSQRCLPECMLIAPLIRYAPELSFQRPIDSITVSGHKMLGCPMPCGIALTRRSHVRKIERRIDYLNSVDTTIMGSRNGHAALHMWHSLRTKGLEGIKAEV